MSEYWHSEEPMMQRCTSFFRSYANNAKSDLQSEGRTVTLHIKLLGGSGSSGLNGKPCGPINLSKVMSLRGTLGHKVSIYPSIKLHKLSPKELLFVMEASQRVRAGQEELKAGVSKTNYKAPWVYSVVTFLHKDVFKLPIRVDWKGQYTRKTMKHMLLGRMSCIWAPRHSVIRNL